MPAGSVVEEKILPLGCDVEALLKVSLFYSLSILLLKYIIYQSNQCPCMRFLYYFLLICLFLSK